MFTCSGTQVSRRCKEGGHHLYNMFWKSPPDFHRRTEKHKPGKKSFVTQIGPCVHAGILYTYVLFAIQTYSSIVINKSDLKNSSGIIFPITKKIFFPILQDF